MKTIKVLVQLELRGEGGLTQENAEAAVDTALASLVDGERLDARIMGAVEEQLSEHFVDALSVTVP